MYGCYYQHCASGVGIVLGIVAVALAVCAIVAYFMAIHSLVKTARAKNSQFGSGMLWFIGLFATPIVLGILVVAQPDRSAPHTDPAGSATTAASDGAPTAPGASA